MKPTVYTDGNTDYKRLTINDDRLWDIHAIVSRKWSHNLWLIVFCWETERLADDHFKRMILEQHLTIKK
jgi:hypothetical protein